jgi:7-carboxy-7-deazaguanine synthase
VPELLYAANDLYAAIQGEGCLAGTAMVLVRLHGCPVGCPFCDTKETWSLDDANRVGTLDEALGTNPRWCEADAPTIAAFTRERFPGPRWALVTGGEPADQDLGPLVRALHAAGYKTAVETSGTARGHVGVGFDWVCVSPKFAMPGGRPVLPDVLRGADEIKMVIGKPADLDTLEAALANLDLSPWTQICLQPVSQSEKMTRFCAETAIRRGLRLSLQIHKSIGMR